MRASSSVGDQDVAGAHLLGRAHRLDLLVVDLLQRLVGDHLAGMLRQERAHQELVAQEGEPLLELVAVLDVARLGRLGHQDDVGEVGDQVLAPHIGRHVLQLGAEVVLGHGEIALVDVARR